MSSSGETTARFCSQCGARLPESARFCPGCGIDIGATARPSAPSRSLRDQIPGLLVLALFLTAGLAIWVRVLQPGARTATAPRGPGGPPPAASAPGSPAQGAPVPADHPPLALPDEAKKFVDSLVARAEAAPNDVSAWRSLAQVQARASEIDQSYGPKAIESFQHVLRLAPDDADAVRGLGNLYYDQQQYTRAAEHYEKYLEKKPDDSSVRTDLATTYLYQGQIDRAVDSYQTVIGKDPDFLQAHFNLGLAWEAKGDRQKALASLAKARSLATDDQTRTRIDRVTSQLEGGGAIVPGGAPPGGAPAGGARPPGAAPAGGAVAPGAGGPPPAAAQGGAPPVTGGLAPSGSGHGGAAPPAASAPAAGKAAPSDFPGAVEAGLRAHQILGPRITAITWPDAKTARVTVANFPMASMPEFARNLFKARLETILDDAKKAHAVTDETAIEIVDGANGATMERVTH